MFAVLGLCIQQAVAQNQIFGRPNYGHSQVMSRWGNAVGVSSYRSGELHQAAYTALAGGVSVRGWMHKDLTWTGESGPAMARFDFALCAEIAVGLSFSRVDITVRGFLRDATSASYPIRTVLYRYSRSTLGYGIFLNGRVANQPTEMVKGHEYTIGYVVDISATCYPRSYAPTASVNLGEQGCSLWWQPTGIFGG
jgi:hypothetical protein